MKSVVLITLLFSGFGVFAQTPMATPSAKESATEMTALTSTTAPALEATAPPALEATAPIAPPPPAAKEKKDEGMQFFGDFRYRQQFEKQAPKSERSIQRLQARLGVSSQVHEDLKLTLRLMTGSSANSGNQTLGDEKAPGMPRRNFGLDQAFIDYKPVNELNLYAGKMPQPFTFAGKNQMLLDRDITLEGIGLKYNQPLDDHWSLFLQGGMFWIRENYDSQFGEDLTDNFLNAIQAGVQWKVDDWTVLAGAGSFSYTDLKDTPPANITAGSTGNGNTLDINGNYPANFDIDQAFVEVKKKLGPVDVSLFYESLKNKDVDVQNKASAFGAIVGYKAWALSWSQQEVQKDAVVGVFTDSDFGGGVTSTRGQMWSVAYKITKKVQLQYTVFNNENALDLIPLKYERSHIDLQVTF